MNQYKEMEEAVLNCFICNPDLLKETRLKAKHFKKYSNFYNFMVAYYERYKSFDLSLLKSACKNPGVVLNYIADIINTTSILSHFKLYEQRLLQLYEEYYAIDEIHKLEQKLYAREIDLDEFKTELKYIFKEGQIWKIKKQLNL